MSEHERTGWFLESSNITEYNHIRLLVRFFVRKWSIQIIFVVGKTLSFLSFLKKSLQILIDLTFLSYWFSSSSKWETKYPIEEDDSNRSSWNTRHLVCRCDNNRSWPIDDAREESGEKRLNRVEEKKGNAAWRMDPPSLPPSLPVYRVNERERCVTGFLAPSKPGFQMGRNHGVFCMEIKKKIDEYLVI